MHYETCPGLRKVMSQDKVSSSYCKSDCNVSLAEAFRAGSSLVFLFRFLSAKTTRGTCQARYIKKFKMIIDLVLRGFSFEFFFHDRYFLLESFDALVKSE